MPLTPERLVELRRAETVILDPHTEIGVTRGEWKELVDAALAWELLENSGRMVWWRQDGWRLEGCGIGYPTPQAAVLAGLRRETAE